MAQSEIPLPSPNVTMSEEMLTRALTAAVKAGNQPSAEEAAKAAAEKARIEQRRQVMIRLAQTEEREKERRQSRCSHKKPDGEWCVGGQAMSNGREVKICLRCQKTIVDEPTQEMVIAKSELQRLADQGRLTIGANGKVEIHESVGA